MMNDERNAPRKPGRPATYVFNKPDSELTDAERKRKSSIEKRRLRQNRSYHRRKALRAAAERLPNPDVDGDIPFHHERVVPSISSAFKYPPKHNFPPAIPTIPHSAGDPFASLEAASSTSPFPFPFHASVSTSRPHGHNLQDLDSEALAIRWNLPKSSVIPELQSQSHTKSSISISNLNLSQPANPMADLSLVVPGILGDESDYNDNNIDHYDDDGTDILVQNALYAAKQASDIRSTVDKQRDMMRMMGIKDMVFDNLHTQITNMSAHVQSALYHFDVFPATFDTKAAIAVTSADAFVINEMMQELIAFNFVQTCGKGRFRLNDTVKMFVKEESIANNMGNIINATNIETANIQNTALRRFRAFFRKQLEQFKGQNIHKVGWQREKAMLVYDAERTNMQLAMSLSQRKSKQALRDFLSAAITVMRYCVTASERERILKDAISDDDVDSPMLDGDGAFFSSDNTTNGAHGGGMDDDDESDEESKKWGCRLQDLANKARLQLALAEAYFDQLKIDEAEGALLKTLNLMGGDSGSMDGMNGTNGAASRMDGTPFFASAGSDVDGTSRVVDSVLVLLLLSNVRMAKRRVKEARTLCVKALRILAAAGLGRSTFGINAMANLTVIYLEEGQVDKAAVVATRLVDTLNSMGYQTMPIFADALGVLGMVSMKKGKYTDAEQLFGSALEIVKLWAAKDWTSMPIHHCADLDIRLLENMACAMVQQREKGEMAKVLAEQAREMGAKRGLIIDDRIHEQQQDMGGRVKLAPRHLY